MSKVKIPLKWYSDLIKIPNTKNEFVLLEWFEEEECKTKTLWCLGKYMKVTQYKINHVLVDTNTNHELTLLLTENPIMSNPFHKSKVNFEKMGEYIKENVAYSPIVYYEIRQRKMFEGGEV